MKRTLVNELEKMIHSRTLLFSFLIGVAVSSANVVENYRLTKWFLGLQELNHVPGYGTLNIYTNWINGANMGMGAAVFFVIFPLLAAIPFSWSLQSERHSGYTNQLLTRSAKKNYLMAKYIAVFLSGGISVCGAMTVNFMANAWILPLVEPMHILVRGGDGMFLSRLLFTKPMIYIFLCLLTSFVWAGTLACLAMTVGMLIKNTVMLVLVPFLLIFGGSFLVNALTPVRNAATGFLGKLTVNPLQLLQAVTLNANPAWYVWSIQLGLLILVSALYFLRGMRDEIL